MVIYVTGFFHCGGYSFGWIFQRTGRPVTPAANSFFSTFSAKRLLPPIFRLGISVIQGRLKPEKVGQKIGSSGKFVSPLPRSPPGKQGGVRRIDASAE